MEAAAGDIEQALGLPAAITALQHAVRLSDAARDRQRRTALAARLAWKAGSPALARAILHDTGGIRSHQADAVRAHVKLFTGDQETAHGYLRRAATQAHGDSAVELAFMAAGAAFQSGRRDDATAAAALIADHRDPAYHQYGA
ncbi:hypothetical protein [Actinophytocola oryzae]|uniref:Tetratricopeptide repeat protein n=1 Tax=Actinophytocola oryzae TaxID=502181 RepID=A0A4R7US87_9PSEU|nr:hypothetical protein [Actinophytocola oryzae]TDV37749.1 hypothetical protein CLV71_12813 [Actinophytocola oryzae]